MQIDDIEEKLNKHKIFFACSWIGKFNIVKMIILLNVIYKYNAILTKILASCSMDISKLILKFIHRGRRPRIANTILKESSKLVG